MTNEIPDDFERLSDTLLQLIAHTMTGSDSAKRAAAVLMERRERGLIRSCRWRIATRQDKESPTGLRITGTVVAKSAEEAAIIFREELAGNAAQRTTSRVRLSTADPRVDQMQVVIDLSRITPESLEVAYDGEAEEPEPEGD